MKKSLIILLMFFALQKFYAQNFLINFAGTGASINVDSVKVENLSQCTTLSLAGSDILNLTTTVGINEFANRYYNSLQIFPNPSSGYCSVEFELPMDNMVYFKLYDMSGKEVLRQEEYLSKGNHTFRLDRIQRGIYTMEIRTDYYRYTAKLVSTASAGSNPVLIYVESAGFNDMQMNYSGVKELKNKGSVKSIISMQFNAGDTLKLTGKSGNYRTVSMLFPNQDQTVTFNFYNCTDADSNHYAAVQLGTQIWMAENLKTTKYRDGSVIPNVPDSAMWGSLTTGAWCDFHNDPAEGAYYGHLYNFYAVADSRNLCPAGWHVASNTEWNIMEKFIDNTVDTTALGGTGTLIGRILKEGCNTRWQYYDSTAGWNSAGFTALCTNFRNSSGAWSLAPNNNHDDSFWTATLYNTNMAWGKSFRWCTRDIYSLFNFDRAGSSVRCIKDY